MNRMTHSTDPAGPLWPQPFQMPHANLPHGLVTFPKQILRWFEPWFLAYGCLGIVQGGMLPLLLPLSSGGMAHAGVIVGMMNLAGLIAPFWGHLADRRRLHRQILLAGMLVTLVPLLLMPADLGLPLKAALAGLLGLGFAAANTVANMFIVEVRPKQEWDARIGACRRSAGWARSPDYCSPASSAAATRWRSASRRVWSSPPCRLPG
jgi:MFS family permease